MICPVLVEEKDLEQIKADMAHLAKGRVELKAFLEKNVTDSQMKAEFESFKNLVLETSKSVEKIREDLEEMPGGYRNSQDIKHLKGRIERLEVKDQSVYDYRIEKLAARVYELEKFLQSGGRVTVHSRLNDMEVYINSLRANKFATVKEMREADDYLARQAIKLEECCKNTVASGKALEDRLNSLEVSFGDLKKYVDALRRMFKSL